MTSWRFENSQQNQWVSVGVWSHSNGAYSNGCVENGGNLRVLGAGALDQISSAWPATARAEGADICGAARTPRLKIATPGGRSVALPERACAETFSSFGGKKNRNFFAGLWGRGVEFIGLAGCMA